MRAGWELGTVGSIVDKSVVFLRFREAPMQEPSCWNVVRYGVTADAGRTDDTLSI